MSLLRPATTSCTSSPAAGCCGASPTRTSGGRRRRALRGRCRRQRHLPRQGRQDPHRRRAAADDGNVYVSELFAGKIARITPSGAKMTFVSTPFPAAFEVRGSRLFTTENVLSGLGPDETPAVEVVRYRR